MRKRALLRSNEERDDGRDAAEGPSADVAQLGKVRPAPVPLPVLFRAAVPVRLQDRSPQTADGAGSELPIR